MPASESICRKAKSFFEEYAASPDVVGRICAVKKVGLGRVLSIKYSFCLSSFSFSAATAGIAGVFNASKLVTVSPDQFTFIVSFTVLAMVVLGGMGSFAGALVGGLLIGVVESLGGLFWGESLGQIGIFLIFIVVLLLRPQGLFGART